MQYIILIETIDKKIHPVELELPTSHISLVHLVKPFQILCDTIIKLEIEELQFSCRKGCCSCCTQMIPLSIPETFFLTTLLNSLEAGHKKRIKKRFAKNKNELYTADLLNKLKDPRSVREMDEAYYELRLACPFLEEGACSIYPDRPFICREYYVHSSPKLCSTAYTTPPGKITTPLSIGPLLAAFTARLTGLAKTPIPHIMAMDWALKFAPLGIKQYPVYWVMEQLLDGLNSACPGRTIIRLCAKETARPAPGRMGEQ